MARKPATRAEFTLFDVVYEDGSQRSNRRVPSGVLGGHEAVRAHHIDFEIGTPVAVDVALHRERAGDSGDDDLGGVTGEAAHESKALVAAVGIGIDLEEINLVFAADEVVNDVTPSEG